MKRRRHSRLRGKEAPKPKPAPSTAYVPTKIACLKDKKNQLLKVARFPKTTCTDRVVFCHEGKLFIKATCDTKGQAMSYADRVKPLARIIEAVR
jgi:hypothetical protein